MPVLNDQRGWECPEDSASCTGGRPQRVTFSARTPIFSTRTLYTPVHSTTRVFEHIQQAESTSWWPENLQTANRCTLCEHVPQMKRPLLLPGCRNPPVFFIQLQHFSLPKLRTVWCKGGCFQVRVEVHRRLTRAGTTSTAALLSPLKVAVLLSSAFWTHASCRHLD